MILDAQRIARRDKLILAGLYLSKYNSVGLRALGFESFTEAFNVIGYALGSRPASIKNYRDEFDPLFPNRRKGWHKRPLRRYCAEVLEEYNILDQTTFNELVKSFVGYDSSARSEVQSDDEPRENPSYFARLITGIAAEQYFESVHATLPEFKGHAMENTTRLGCGYDFRLKPPAHNEFLAVEVKGLKERKGSVSLTPKERDTAKALKGRFFLFVVKNFKESPFHEIHQDPLSGKLNFTKAERVTVHVSWLTNV